MKTFRLQRLNKLILEELSKLVARELEFGNALVTLTKVEVSENLENAIAGVSVLPSDKIEEVMKILKEARPRLQHLLLKKINIRHIPIIVFQTDQGFENAAGVERSLMEDDTDNKGI